MNKKINTICFILLFFILVGIASASEDSDEALQTIKQPDVVKINVNSSDTVLSKSLEGNTPIQATSKNVLEAKKSTSKSKVTLKASDVKMYYGDGSKFKITLKNNKNSPMKNTKLKITINDKTYSKKTNDEGKILLAVNFDSGKYKVTTSYEGSDKYEKKSISNTITVKSTIKAGDVSKYYKNKKAYTATFLDCNGNVLKKTKVKYQMDKTVKSGKTNSKGELSFKINSKPGAHVLYLKNTKTGEVVARSVTVKNTIQHYSYTMTRDAMVSYSVKIVDGDGKALKNKKVTFTVANKKYSAKSDANGIATLVRNFDVGSHLIKSSYGGQEIGYQFEVYPISAPDTPAPEPQKVVKKTNFTHSISIPDYVNVTADYVFKNSKYVLQSGYDGIIKMPKNDVFRVLVNGVQYNFTNQPIVNYSSYILDGYCYLVPFDGSPVLHKYNKESLVGEGLLIYNENGSNIMEFRSSTQTDTDLFSVFLSHLLHGETICYLQNDVVKAQISFFTYQYDQEGINSNLAKTPGYMQYDSSSKTYVTVDPRAFYKYAQTNLQLAFTTSGYVYPEQLSSEKINTKLFVNDREELDRSENISYGLDPEYFHPMGFEVLQSFAFINEKVTEEVFLDWISKNQTYLNQPGYSNAYGMFLSALETAWLADEVANQNSALYNVNWQRDRPVVVMGGINLKDTYLHILNSDMGMSVSGEDENATLFKLVNSFYLSDIEEYGMSAINDEFNKTSTNSIDEVISAISAGNFSIVQYDDLMYIFSENENHSAIIFNTTSGVVSVISVKDGVAYKGAVVDTSCYYCKIIEIPTKIVHYAYRAPKVFKDKGIDMFDFISKNSARLGALGYYLSNSALGIGGKLLLSTTSSAAFAMVSSIMGVHAVSNYIKNNFISENDWNKAYTHFTASRDTILQNKKIFTIPKSNNKYVHVEVDVKKDGSLDRNNAILYTDGGSRKLSVSETYNYFKEESWVPWEIPKKYQPHPVPF